MDFWVHTTTKSNWEQLNGPAAPEQGRVFYFFICFRVVRLIRFAVWALQLATGNGQLISIEWVALAGKYIVQKRK